MVLNKRSRFRWAATAVALALCVGLLAVACDGGGGDGGNGQTLSGELTPGQTIELPPVTPGTLPPDPSPTVGPQRAPEEAATDDLVARFDVTRDAVEVISVTSMDFPDACLGLSQPDEACAEVVTPGFEVVLGFASTVVTYHTTADGTIVRFAGVSVKEGNN